MLATNAEARATSPSSIRPGHFAFDIVGIVRGGSRTSQQRSIAFEKRTCVDDVSGNRC